MFASIYAYQLVNIIIALVAVALLRRILPAGLRGWLRAKLGRLASTEFRRLWCLEAPLFAALAALAVIGSGKLFYPWFHRTFPDAPIDGTELMFLTMGMAWYGALLIFPTIGLWLAWRRREAPATRRLDRGLAVTAATCCGALMYWVMCFEPNNIVVEPVQIGFENWPEGRAPLRIVVLADIQSPVLGERERRIPEIVAELAPDIILIPGDLIAQSLDSDFPRECGRYVATRLSAPLGVYAVNGDVDMFIEGGLASVLEGTGVRLLDNERIDLGDGIILDGCDPRQARSYRALVRVHPEAAVHIAMVHRPRHVHELGREGCNLVVAGHTHGGQVCLPGGRALATNCDLEPARARGVHRHPADSAPGEPGSTWMHVGAGLGTSPYARIRVACRPEAVLLTLVPIGEG